MRSFALYCGLRKIFSWILLFLIHLSLLHPVFLDATIIDGASENMIFGENNGYVGVTNS